MSELFRKIDENFGGSMSWNTQPIGVFFMIPILWWFSFFCNIKNALLSPFFSDFAGLFFNLTVQIRALFPKSTSILRLVTNILEDAFELIFRGQTRRSSTGTLISWTSGSRHISLILQHERPRRRIRVYQLCALIEIVTETAIVSVRTLPVDFPLPTIT